MINPHPPLTGLPSGILLLVIIAESCVIFGKSDEWRRKCSSVAGFALLTLVVISPLTYFSGYWGAEAASKIAPIADDLVSRHEGFGRFYLIVVLLTGLLRLVAEKATALRGVFYMAYWLSLIVTAAGLLFTSHLGGELVFEHGAGVSVERITIPTDSGS